MKLGFKVGKTFWVVFILGIVGLFGNLAMSPVSSLYALGFGSLIHVTTYFVIAAALQGLVNKASNQISDKDE